MAACGSASDIAQTRTTRSCSGRIEAGRVDKRGLEFEQVVSDIQTLNDGRRRAARGDRDLDGRLPGVADRYVLMPHGASMGIGYGPVVVAREPLSLDELRGLEIVIPGRLTTAYLVLRLALGEECQGSRAAVRRDPRRGLVGPGRRGPDYPRGAAHLRGWGLRKILDLGEWWQARRRLPLPLGVNAARRDLGERLGDVSAVLGEAIRVGLENREEAMVYARAVRARDRP